MELVVVLLVIAIIPAMIAASKGRNFLLWYIYGVALWIIALVHSVLLKSKAQEIIEAKALREAVAPSHSAADEIERFAKLKDSGALTEEEFQAKKRQLLGLA